MAAHAMHGGAASVRDYINSVSISERRDGSAKSGEAQRARRARVDAPAVTGGAAVCAALGRRSRPLARILPIGRIRPAGRRLRTSERRAAPCPLRFEAQTATKKVASLPTPTRNQFMKRLYAPD